jgi:hypothetical protein
MTIKKFAIYGERCSGTNYLENLMLENFVIEFAGDEFNHKHFIGTYSFKQTENENQTLFIGIVRNPIEWINSFYKEQHLVKNRPRPLTNFLFDEFISVNEKNEQLKEDTNYMTNTNFKNLFELRFVKNYYLINVLKNKVKNYALINYEFIRDSSEEFLKYVEQRFNLTRKNPEFKKITYYKKDKNTEYNKKQMEMPFYTQLLCIKHLNKQQEAKLGYNLINPRSESVVLPKIVNTSNNSISKSNATPKLNMSSNFNRKHKKRKKFNSIY